MLEKDLSIRIPETKFRIYGKFFGSLKKPLFIIVHGLPANMNEHFYYHAREWFAKKGYATFGFNLYDWRDGSRQLIDSTLKTHGSDLDAVVAHFRKKGVKKIFVVGHSYGGATILNSKERDFDAAVLLDASFKSTFTKKRYGAPAGRYIKELKGYFERWGVGVVIGEKMAHEADTLKWELLTKGWKRPLKVIAAGKGVLIKGARQYYKLAEGPKELLIIPGATHYFNDRPGMEERVYREAEKWFRKF